MRRDIENIADGIIENTEIDGVVSNYLIEKCEKAEAFLFQFLTKEECFLIENSDNEEVVLLIKQQVYDLFELLYFSKKQQSFFAGFESAKNKVLEWIEN